MRPALNAAPRCTASFIAVAIATGSSARRWPCSSAPHRSLRPHGDGGSRDWLRGPAVTCAPTATAVEVAALAPPGGAAVVVVSADGGPLGIVTDRDLRAKVVAAGREASSTRSRGHHVGAAGDRGGRRPGLGSAARDDPPGNPSPRRPRRRSAHRRAGQRRRARGAGRPSVRPRARHRASAVAARRSRAWRRRSPRWCGS